MADIVILTLIIGYCVFLIYRGYKNKKAGKRWAAQGAAETADPVAAVRPAQGEKRM